MPTSTRVCTACVISSGLLLRAPMSHEPPKSPSSSPSTTRKRACRPVRAPLPGPRRARPQLRNHLRQRRQPRPLGGHAARAVPEAPRRHARRAVQRQLRPAHGDHGRLRARARRSASSRSTPTCRTRPRRSASCSPRWTRATTTSARSAAMRQDSRVPPHRLEGHEPPARTHHPHPHDRPGLHAARLQPRHRRRHQLSAAR
jgi:hypothetical protein